MDRGFSDRFWPDSGRFRSIVDDFRSISGEENGVFIIFRPLKNADSDLELLAQCENSGRGGTIGGSE